MAKTRNYMKSLTRNSNALNTSHVSDASHRDRGEELFAERFQKVEFRNFQNTTRLNIKNTNWNDQKAKRDRANEYWKNTVIQNHLPPISSNKKAQREENIKMIE